MNTTFVSLIQTPSTHTVDSRTNLLGKLTLNGDMWCINSKHNINI